MALPSPDDFIAAATALWGTPTERKRLEWRFGTHGSKSIRLDSLTWHDHEAGQGGGAIELCEQAGIAWRAEPNGRGNRQDRQDRGTPEAVYPYHDEAGTHLYDVVRFPDHRFAQRTPDGRWSLKGVRRVLYRLPQLLTHQRANAGPDTPTFRPVFIPEGEKDCDTLAKLGLTATTNPGGVGKWREEYAPALRGLSVVILPDNDEPGRQHAQDVARKLGTFPAAIRILELPDLPPKGDVTDWVAAGGTRAQLLDLVERQARPPTPPAPQPQAAGPATQRARQPRPAWRDHPDCQWSGGEHPGRGPSGRNACLLLELDPHWQGAFSFDEMAQAARRNESPPRELTDDDTTSIQRYMQIAGLKRIGRDIVGQAIQHVARQTRFHPLRDYLNALDWDGTERIGEWLSTYLGVARSPYADAVGALFLRSMVARIFQPGCKADYMLILEGPQGKLKSSACRILAGGDVYFSDSLPDLTNMKECSIHLAGKWLIEVAELHAFGRAEATLLKSFLSRTAEQYRPPYGINEVTQPRQCVFIGTSNKDTYLKDETGGRRFWPVVCNTIDLDSLTRDRNQLLGEALWQFRQNLPWWPDPAFEALHIRPEQDARFEFDPWSDHVERFVTAALEPSIPTAAIAEALGVKTDRLDPPVARRISAIMRKLGWNLAHTKAGNRWTRPGER